DIDVRELGADGAQRGDGLGREAALRKIRRALHVEEHRVLRELLANTVVHIHRSSSVQSMSGRAGRCRGRANGSAYPGKPQDRSKEGRGSGRIVELPQYVTYSSRLGPPGQVPAARREQQQEARKGPSGPEGGGIDESVEL